MLDLTELADRWRADLAAWAIPRHITAAASESPWVLPRQVFARRADRLASDPAGPSYEREWAALDPPDSVLDVGSGAGAACLPLLPRASSLTAVDSDPGMLELLAQRAAALGAKASQVLGSWPEVAAQTPPADLVTCHHVLYNVPEPVPFLAAMGLRPQSVSWSRPGGPDYASFAELVDVTRRRLCLPAARADDIGAALVAADVDPEHPADLGSSGREVVTIWWDGNSPEIW